MLQRLLAGICVFLFEARLWFRRIFKPAVIKNRGISLQTKHPAISSYMRSVMYEDYYETPELQILEQTLEASDRVLEIGGGAGVVSAYVARKCGDDRVTVVEANPKLVTLIEENHRLNGVKPRLINAAATQDDRETETLHVSEHFWSSSTTIEKSDRITVPAVNAKALVHSLEPSYLIIDIEGAEIEIVPTLDLASVRKILIELHPKSLGPAGVIEVLRQLFQKGFEIDFERSIKAQLYLVRSDVPDASPETPSDPSDERLRGNAAPAA